MRSFWLWLLLGCAAMPVSALTAADSPNIVLILADDLGYGDIGCYGNEINRTPHLDRLAHAGLRFTDFHANAANCSPTRAALLTGRYQQRSGIEGALGESARGLRKDEITIAERLQEAGYATALIGKWHLGYHPENGPVHHGFDRFVGHLHGATDYHSHVDKYGRMDWWHDEKPVDEKGYNTDLITRHSVRFIEKNRGRPFFLMVSHSAIHFPWMTPDDEPHRKAGNRYDDITGKLGPHAEGTIRPVVQRMIEDLDSSVGEIVKTLDSLGLAEDTLVFFTSDNGGIVKMAGVPIVAENRISSNAPLRGQKHGLFEGGHRVPAIAWWPGTIEPGSITAETSITMDLFSTFLDLAGLDSPPQGDPQALDGISLLPILTQQGSLPDHALFWRMGDSRAIRSEKWKAVSLHGSPFELFDLDSDLSERENLASQHPEILNGMIDQLRTWEAPFQR